MIEKTLKIDGEIYYIYLEHGEYKITNKNNFNARIQNANTITTLFGFTNPNQVVNYLKQFYKNVEVL